MPILPLILRFRECIEFAAIFGVAALLLFANAWMGTPARQPLAVLVACWATAKTCYYFAETLRHLQEATAADLAYHRFLLLVAYNMAQITLSFAIDFYVLYQIDPTSLNGIDPDLRGAELAFECFYFSVLNFSFFGYGDITPAHVPGKIVMVLQVVTAFATVIFLLSDFVSMKESMRRKQS